MDEASFARFGFFVADIIEERRKLSRLSAPLSSVGSASSVAESVPSSSDSRISLPTPFELGETTFASYPLKVEQQARVSSGNYYATMRANFYLYNKKGERYELRSIHNTIYIYDRRVALFKCSAQGVAPRTLLNELHFYKYDIEKWMEARQSSSFEFTRFASMNSPSIQSR